MHISRHIIGVIMVFALIVVGGSYFYQTVEGWETLDSIYFVFVTMTTVGYGDLSPVTNMGKMFTIIFSFVSILLFLYVIGIVSSYISKKAVNKKVRNIRDSVRTKEMVEKVLDKQKKKRRKR